MGYLSDQSMSENAAAAYGDGLKPFSKICAADLKGARLPVSLADLKRLIIAGFIEAAQWHHTSKMFQETDFYDLAAIHEQIADWGPEKLQKNIAASKKETAPPATAESEWFYALLTFEEWEGSRRHGSFKQYEKFCVVNKGWGFLGSGGKKSLSGSHIISVENLGQRKPRAMTVEQKNGALRAAKIPGKKP